MNIIILDEVKDLTFLMSSLLSLMLTKYLRLGTLLMRALFDLWWLKVPNSMVLAVSKCARVEKEQPLDEDP